MREMVTYIHYFCQQGYREVTCGSAMKFVHETGCRLHSHDVKYGSGHGGSGQQVLVRLNPRIQDGFFLLLLLLLLLFFSLLLGMRGLLEDLLLQNVIFTVCDRHGGCKRFQQSMARARVGRANLRYRVSGIAYRLVSTEDWRSYLHTRSCRARVPCGSVIRLQHLNTKAVLHSHESVAQTLIIRLRKEGREKGEMDKQMEKRRTDRQADRQTDRQTERERERERERESVCVCVCVCLTCLIYIFLCTYFYLISPSVTILNLLFQQFSITSVSQSRSFSFRE